MSKKEQDFPISDVLEDIVELTDEDGNEVSFELLDVVDYKGTEYAVLFPCDEPDSTDVLIMRLEDDPEDPEKEYYYPVEQEDTMNAVFAKFKELNRDVFDFLE